MHEHIKSLLLDALTACTPRLAVVDLLDDEADTPRLYPCADENEYASRVTEMGVNLSLKARTRQRRTLIENALKRLDAGDFGVCEDCGDDIALARLLANPTATLCVHCQADREGAPRLRCA